MLVRNHVVAMHCTGKCRVCKNKSWFFFLYLMTTGCTNCISIAN